MWAVLLAISIGFAVLDQFHQPVRAIPQADGTVYTLSALPDYVPLNDYVLVSQTFRPDTVRSLRQLLPLIRRRFRRNPYPDAVLHGNSAHVPVGWAYIAIRNDTRQPMELVLSFPQYRCNQATLYTGQGGRFVVSGTFSNDTPLGDRFFPFFHFAFPFTIPPQTTLPLLLRTRNFASYHEVDLRLSGQRLYTGAAFAASILDGANVLVFLILAIVALLIGWLSESILLRWYGIYLLSISLLVSSYVGYLSLLPYPAGTSLNPDTTTTMCRILVNLMVHPFFYLMIRPALRHPRRYRQFICGYWLLSGLLVLLLHLVPLTGFGSINYEVNRIMIDMTYFNICWLLLYAVLAYRRERIWSPLAVCLLALTPLILGQLIAFIRAWGMQDTYRQTPPNPAFILFILIYITFDQFRKELVTRQRMQTRERRLTEHTEAIRRQEIEHIGRDLHDQVGNTLATALGFLSRSPHSTDKLRTIIVSAITELRFLSHNLVKDDDRPLTLKTETLVSRFNDFTAIRLQYTDYTGGRINDLSPLKQQNLYRIIQELLTNIIRHSGATQASVQFFCDDTTVDISVEDDGTGFDITAGQERGIGIQMMHKRAALSAISIRFDAAPTGTTVLLKTSFSDSSFSLHDADTNHSD